MIEQYFIKHNVTSGANILIFFPEYKGSNGEFNTLLGTRAMNLGLCQLPKPKEPLEWKWDEDRAHMFLLLESPIPPAEVLLHHCCVAQAAVTEIMDELARCLAIRRVFNHGG
ncbi:MAG: hypothetical protein MUO99_04265 [Dehalococcoidales bacterium]|nr:hypothetical protein [Dehalococcoidales bacterium]